MKDNIRGEENNYFTNTLGKQVQVHICQRVEETASLLETVLDGNHVASLLLAKAVHIDFTDPPLQLGPLPLDTRNIGIWVDPLGKLMSLFPRLFTSNNLVTVLVCLCSDLYCNNIIIVI